MAKGKKNPIVTVKLCRQSAEAEHAFCQALNSIIRDVAKRVIQQRREEHGKEQSYGSPVHRLDPLLDEETEGRELPAAVRVVEGLRR